ncbi:MAG: hypothetical protein HUJ56_11835, partial [Erysipelotrichaceae bacterium]|nr:hypothetical protein [Erysipelotrichaceae bacterium]
STTEISSELKSKPTEDKHKNEHRSHEHKNNDHRNDKRNNEHRNNDHKRNDHHNKPNKDHKPQNTPKVDDGTTRTVRKFVAKNKKES